MKLSLFVMLFSVLSLETYAQNPFVGTFTGSTNGDIVTLTLQSQSGNTLVGKMKDSQQIYDVNATTNGSKINGTAVEKTMNLTFILNGTLNGNHLLMGMTIEVLGQKQALEVDFTKQNATTASTKAPEQTPLYAKPNLPAGGKIDQNLVGKWVNEQIYNSGSGDSFLGGTTTQSLIFYADGSLSDGGSSTTVSGSNYYGSSSDKGASPAIPNVSWYVQNQHIFIKDFVSGQTVDLGRYYIENGALLITGNNGKKLLFRKK